jgi:regulator of RNase E activity RraA
MSARAKSKGVQGVVIDGRVRDLNEHRQMNFPVTNIDTIDAQYQM